MGSNPAIPTTQREAEPAYRGVQPLEWHELGESVDTSDFGQVLRQADAYYPGRQLQYTMRVEF